MMRTESADRRGGDARFVADFLLSRGPQRGVAVHRIRPSRRALSSPADWLFGDSGEDTRDSVFEDPARIQALISEAPVPIGLSRLNRPRLQNRTVSNFRCEA